MQIKNSHKVTTAITFLVALLFITAFKEIENIEQSQNTSGSQSKADSLYIDIPILMMSDNIEALRKFITGWQEVHE